MSVDLKASIPRSAIEISPKQCVFSLLNISNAANSDLLWIRRTTGKAEVHWPVAISLPLKTYSARGKVSKSAGKLEKILLSHSTVCYPGSHVWSLFYFYLRLKWEVTSRSAKFLHLEEKGLIQPDLKTMWVSCLFDLQTRGPPANLTGMCFQDLFPFWVCCLQPFQSTALQIFSSPRQSHSSADALGTIEKCALLK